MTLPSQEDTPTGLHRMNFRGLTFREMWRFSNANPMVFLVCLGLKLNKHQGSQVWLPFMECEKRATWEEVSEALKERLQARIKEAEALGYGRWTYNLLARNFDPHTKDAAGAKGLSADGSHYISIHLLTSVATGTEKTVTALGATAYHSDGTCMEFLAHSNYTDTHPSIRRVRVKSASLPELQKAMAAHLSKRADVRHFSSWDEVIPLEEEFSRLEAQSAVKRGLYVAE